jgi:hypothetical protein
MAIIKCDDELQSADDTSKDPIDDAILDTFVEQDAVTSLGKTLFAVEYDNYSSAPPSREVYPDVFNADIADKFRAALGRYWYLSDDDNVVFIDTNDTWFKLTQVPVNDVRVQPVMGGDDFINWMLSIMPAEETFTDHAFTMNTPFSKKDLEMFENISDSAKFDVADVESDYDFFSKAYEEGIASTTVPENALPHLYTEVQRGESGVENTDKLPQGYLRQWVNEVLTNAEYMGTLSNQYSNVAILDSVVDEENVLDSENKTTSAFEILMAYANRENLFPMNVNIEVNTNDASELMFSAESVGMADDIVKLLMGDGILIEPEPVEWKPEFDFGRTVNLPEPTTFSWKRTSNELSYDFGWWFGSNLVDNDDDLLRARILGKPDDGWSSKWRGISTDADGENMLSSMIGYIVDRDEKNEMGEVNLLDMSDVNNWDMLYWGDANKDSTKDGDIRVRIYVDERGPKGKGNDGTVYIYEEVLKED